MTWCGSIKLIMERALFKDEIVVSTDVAEPIHVSREGPVRRYVTPPL